MSIPCEKRRDFMKKIFLLAVIVLAAMLLLPLTALENLEVTPTSAPSTTPLKSTNQTKTFKVLISSTNTVTEITADDYIFGVVAAEMPALYHEEALKAQAVCAYTFALWRQKENAEKEYDITDDFTVDQAYISRQAALEKWGENAEEYTKKIEKAINDTKNLTITHNKEIILSVYHAISCGSTESAENIWGKDYPYLKTVSSAGDKLADNYISTVTVNFETLKTTFGETEQPLNNCFTDFNRSEQGTVISLKVFGKEYSGSEVRKLLNLKSQNFEVAYSEDGVTFTVYGYGHGVGLSQNGANYMANQGSTFKEILTHYYTNCEITNNS